MKINILIYLKYIIYYFIISFHLILKRINNSINKIKNIIDSNKYLTLFLDRKKENYSLNLDINNIYDINPNIKNYLLLIENSESIDWFINNIIYQKWKSFEI